MAGTNDAIFFQGTYKGLNLIVRGATHADYNDVMAIDPTINDGFDYLYASYQEFLGDPASHSFVAVVENQVAAFNCFWVDGVTSTWSFGTTGRMTPQYRHLGLFLAFGDITKWAMKQRFPSLQFHWGVVAHHEKMISLAKQRGSKLGHAWNHVQGNVPFSQLHQTLESLKSADEIMQPSSVTSVVSVLKDRKILKYLFPSGFMFYAYIWKVFPTDPDLIRKNIRMTDVFLSIDGDTVALSTMHILQCRSGRSMMMCYSGSPDIRVIRSHMLSGIIKCVRVAGIEKESCGLANPAQLTLEFCFNAAAEVDIDEINDFLTKTIKGYVQNDWLPQVILNQSRYPIKPPSVMDE